MKKCILLCLLLSLLVGCAPTAAPYDGPAKALLDIPCYTETVQELGSGTAVTSMAATAGSGFYYLAGTEAGDSLQLSLYRAEKTGGTAQKLWTCPPAQEGEGSHTVTAILPGEGDSVWLMETTTRYIFDLPKNFDENLMDKWDYYQFRGNAMTFRHIQSDGTVEQAFTLDGLMSAFTCALWQGGSLYCAGENRLTVLSPTGGVLAACDLPGYVDALASAGDSVAVFCRGDDGKSRMHLLQQDMTFTDGAALPMAIKAPTVQESEVLFTRQGSLFAWNTQTGSGQKHLDWQDVGRNRAHIRAVLPQADGTVLALHQKTPGEDAQLLTLSEAPRRLTAERELILGVLDADESILSLVLQFNLRRNGGNIRVADYAEFEALGQSGMDQLRLDLAGGRLPDLLRSGDPYHPITELAPGMLQELSPYLQQDAAISGQGLMDSVFDALRSRDGGLLTVTPSFRLSTTVALGGTVLPVPLSVSRTELLCAGLDSDGVSPMEPYTEKSAALTAHLHRNGLVYDGPDGFALDSEVFRQGLRLAALYPDKQELSAYKNLPPQWSRVRQGAQLYLSSGYGSFSALAHDLSAAGEGAVLAGWPDVEGGHVLEVWESWGMTTACRDKELGWLFLRQLLLDETQASMALSGFPTNRTAFHRAGRSAMQSGKTAFYPMGEEMVEISEKLTSTQYYAIEKAALSAVTLAKPVEAGLAEAICHAAAEYFAGTMAEEDAIIAARTAVSLYPDPTAP